MSLRRPYLALLVVLVMARGAHAQSAELRDWRLTVALGGGQTFGSADPTGYRHEVRRLDLFAVGIERILDTTLSVELTASFLTFFVPFLDAAARVSWAPLEQRASGPVVFGAIHGTIGVVLRCGHATGCADNEESPIVRGGFVELGAGYQLRLGGPTSRSFLALTAGALAGGLAGTAPLSPRVGLYLGWQAALTYKLAF